MGRQLIWHNSGPSGVTLRNRPWSLVAGVEGHAADKSQFQRASLTPSHIIGKPRPHSPRCQFMHQSGPLEMLVAPSFRPAFGAPAWSCRLGDADGWSLGVSTGGGRVSLVEAPPGKRIDRRSTHRSRVSPAPQRKKKHGRQPSEDKGMPGRPTEPPRSRDSSRRGAGSAGRAASVANRTELLAVMSGQEEIRNRHSRVSDGDRQTVVGGDRQDEGATNVVRTRSFDIVTAMPRLGRLVGVLAVLIAVAVVGRGAWLWFTRGPTTPLLLAAHQGATAAVKRLLKDGADPNERDTSGGTPLSVAARGGHRFGPHRCTGQSPEHLETIRVLLVFGADPTVPDGSG